MTPAALNILYEDNHIIVCEKPPGLLSQSDQSGHPDLLSLIREYIRRSRNKPGEVYIALIHRLDRNVGGPMVFALTSKAAARLSRQFRERRVEKRYLALCLNRPQNDQGELLDWMKRDVAQRMALPATPEAPGAQQARLRFRLLQSGRLSDGQPASLLEIELETGRFHQIRFQLSRHGCPIVGDRKYGRSTYHGPLHLHCCLLAFEHPVRHNPMRLASQAPPDWQALIAGAAKKAD